MKTFLLSLIFISILQLKSYCDYIYLPPGTCLTAPSGTFFCADTLIVDTNACFIAGDSSVICQGMVIRGGGIIVIAIENISSEIPKSFELYQNYPNPFNPTTNIKFDIPKLSKTTVKIYDVLGKEISTIVNEELKPGKYSVGWNASNFSSGIYFCKIVAGDYTETKKMILIK